PAMGGYQLPVALDIFRGRYRKSFADPSPIPANQVQEYKFRLPTVNYEFKPGHRIMVQIQSSLFPLYDRNPQSYVPNILFAKPSDYRKATVTIEHGVDRLEHGDVRFHEAELDIQRMGRLVMAEDVKGDSLQAKMGDFLLERGECTCRVALATILRSDDDIVDVGYPTSASLLHREPEGPHRLVDGSGYGEKAVVARRRSLGQKLVKLRARAVNRVLRRPVARPHFLLRIARNHGVTPGCELGFGDWTQNRHVSPLARRILPHGQWDQRHEFPLPRLGELAV